MASRDAQPKSDLREWAKRSSEGLRVRLDEPLRKHSTLRIGGPATAWIEVDDRERLREVARRADAWDLPVELIGLGSNVLFPDEGIDGLVVRLTGSFGEWSVDEDVTDETDEALVEVGAGVVNAHLVRGLLADGWVGAEFLTLIPGTFGGAIAMNAGTKDGELAEILSDADLLVPEPSDDGSREWTLQRFAAEELGLAYRRSELPDDAIIVSGRIRVRRGDVEGAREHMKYDKDRRNETQPYRLASVGSTFANPDDDYAGRLIDEAGLKGHRVGGARISEHHANFFINDEDATAEDFLRLMAVARWKVREQFDVELRPEVRFVGFDGMAKLKEYEREMSEDTS